ncbi:MAG: SDR family NAD(P)-dependent oxidoreductase [Pseudomonadota bacterium]
MADFTDKIALVTGASRGLGYALAQHLGASGAHVVAVARTVGGLEELDDAIQRAGGQATLVPLDVTDDPALERMAAAIFERWGRLDIWVHTAVHTLGQTPVEHIQEKDLDRAIAVNFRATQRLIRVVDPLLRQSAEGRALFFADPSVAERPYHAGYRSILAGRHDLVADWARGLTNVSQVRVATVAPPPLRTAVRARLYPGAETEALADPTTVAPAIVELLAGIDASQHGQLVRLPEAD